MREGSPTYYEGPRKVFWENIFGCSGGRCMGYTHKKLGNLSNSKKRAYKCKNECEKNGVSIR